MQLVAGSSLSISRIYVSRVYTLLVFVGRFLVGTKTVAASVDIPTLYAVL